MTNELKRKEFYAEFESLFGITPLSIKSGKYLIKDD